MLLAAKTDVGLKRENNQDSYTFGEIMPGVCFAVVCDGMGGASEGEFASHECVKIVSKRITDGYYEGISELSMRALLVSSLEYANKKIYEKSLGDKKYEGMGTTAVIAVVTPDSAYIAHAGDSRAYLICPDEKIIMQLTRDHSVVQRMVDDGTITEAQAVDHPKKHLITRAIGVDKTVRVDFDQEDISPGNIILLCTDGLTNYLTVEELAAKAGAAPLEKFVTDIVNTAISNGGGDNITAVAICV